MRRGGAGGGRYRVDVLVGLQEPERAAPEQEDHGDDRQPDYGGAPMRRRNEPTRRSSAARPEAVAGRRVRRSPQEVGLMMGDIDQGVKEVASEHAARAALSGVSAQAPGWPAHLRGLAPGLS